MEPRSNSRLGARAGAGTLAGYHTAVFRIARNWPRDAVGSIAVRAAARGAGYRRVAGAIAGQRAQG